MERSFSSSSSSCFFCYKPTGKCWAPGKDEGSIKSCHRFLQLFHRHLKIRNDNIIIRGGGVLRNNVISECAECTKILDSFCQLYDAMKILELRADWEVSKLEGIMREADRSPSRVQFFKGTLQTFATGHSSGEGEDDKDIVGRRGTLLEEIAAVRKTIIVRERRMSSSPTVSLKRYHPSPSPPPGVIEEEGEEEEVVEQEGSFETRDDTTTDIMDTTKKCGDIEESPNNIISELDDNPKIEISSTISFCVKEDAREDDDIVAASDNVDVDQGDNSLDTKFVSSSSDEPSPSNDNINTTVQKSTPPEGSTSEAVVTVTISEAGLATTPTTVTTIHTSSFRVIVKPDISERHDDDDDESDESEGELVGPPSASDDDDVKFVPKFGPEIDNPVVKDKKSSQKRKRGEHENEKKKKKICRKKFGGGKCGNKFGTGDDRLSCVFCGRQCVTRTVLETHLRSHTNERLICPICKSENGSLTYHLQTAHRVPSNLDIDSVVEATPTKGSRMTPSFDDLPTFPCSVGKCKAKFLSPSSRDAHLSHHGDLKCSMCDASKEYSVALALHELEHDDDVLNGCPPEESKSKMYACLRCNSKFTTSILAEYLWHHSEVHLGLARLNPKCPICTAPFHGNEYRHYNIMRRLRDHFGAAHDTSGMRPEEVARCDQCPAYFKRLPQLDLHKRDIHGSLVVFNCQDCGKVFGSRKLLLQHRNNRHLTVEDLKFACSAEGCPSRFEAFRDLQSHQRQMHTPKNPKVVCPTCGKLCWKNTLAKHMLLHREKGAAAASSTRPKAIKPKVIFVCDQCGMSFSSKYLVEQHQFSHSGPSSWKHSCPVCGKKCFGKSSLEGHLRTHTQEKPFSCRVCGEAYAHRHNLRAHVNRVHSDVMEDRARPVARKVISSKKGRKVEHVFDTSVKL